MLQGALRIRRLSIKHIYIFLYRNARYLRTPIITTKPIRTCKP